jgi:hypothetical protein
VVENAMRIVVTGGRDFADEALVEKALGGVHRKHGIAALIEGEARGADRLCASWAERHAIPVERFPADWDRHGKRAGHLRNQQMIDEGKPDAAVAFPGGRGTADMVARLTAQGIPVWQP